ncbi:MAG: response regulator [Marivivens sp.]|nr:response regulator [Marivivens sp.]
MTKDLIVEDEPLIVTVIAMTFEKHGCSVTAVDETLDSLSEERPDVGLLDINLYQEFSYPVAERLNEMGIPFAFFTAYDDNTLPDVFVGRPIIPKNDRRDDIVAKVKGLLRA